MENTEEIKVFDKNFSYKTLKKRLRTKEEWAKNEALEENITKLYSKKKYYPNRERGGGTPFYQVWSKLTLEEIQDLNSTLSKEERSEKKRIKEEGLKFHISLPEEDGKLGIIEEESNDYIAGRTQYCKGWEIVSAILQKHDVFHYKIADNEVRMSAEYVDEKDKADFLELPALEQIKAATQRGKDITIYAHDQKAPFISFKQWINILQEITEALIKAEVRPGYKVMNLNEIKQLATLKGINQEALPKLCERIDNRIKNNPYLSYRYDISEEEKQNRQEAILAEKKYISKQSWPVCPYKNIISSPPIPAPQQNPGNDPCCSCTLS